MSASIRMVKNCHKFSMEEDCDEVGVDEHLASNISSPERVQHLASNITSPKNIPKSKQETPKIYFPELTVEKDPEDSLESSDSSTSGQESAIQEINDCQEVNIIILTAAVVVLSCDRVTGDDEEPLAVLEEADVVANILLGQGGHILEHEVHLLEPHTGAEHRKDTSSVAVRVWGVVQD